MRKILVFFMLLMIGMMPSIMSVKAAEAPQNWDSQAALDRVNNLGQRLLESNGLPSEGIVFMVSENDHVNAYANIKNEICVYRGLLHSVGTDDGELAAVISHELGHIVNSHVKKHVAVQVGVTAAVIGATIADSKIRKPRALQTINQYSPIDISIAGATGAAGTMVSNKISREDEFEADLTGVDIMVNAGYNPLAMISFLSKLGDNYYDFFSTHPSGDRRLMNIYDYVAYNYPRAIEIGYNSEAYKRALTMINQKLQARTLADQKEVAKKQAKLRAEKEERAGKINKEEEPWLLDWKTQQMLQSSSQFQGGPKSQFTYPNAQAPRPQRPQNSYQTPTATQKPQIQKHKTYSNTQQQVQKTNQYQPKFELNPQFKNQVQY